MLACSWKAEAKVGVVRVRSRGQLETLAAEPAAPVEHFLGWASRLASGSWDRAWVAPASQRDDPSMRITPIIGQKPWFLLCWVGVGRARISLEGWASTALFAAATSVAKKKGLARQPMQVLLGSFSVIVALIGY